MRSLHGNVPRAVEHLPAIGNLPGTRQLNLAIGLPLHNQAELDDLLQQLYDPASPNFHKFLTPAEFTARFGPTEADYVAVRQFAATNGLIVTGTFDNHLLLDVAGSAASVERAFHVTLRTYRHPTENRDFFAPDTEPTVDANLPIADVSGLQNYSRPYPKMYPMPKTVSPQAGSATTGGYIGDDFRNAYVPGTALDGSGQAVGLVQFDGFYASDIANYASQAGRTNIPLQVVKLDGFSGTPTTGANSGNAEVSLDIEMAMSMAPALSRIVVFEGNPNNFIPNDVLNAMAASNTVKNLSCSWGWSGGPTTTTDNIFKMMAADGQSFFTASGDSDAYPAGLVDNAGQATTPASSPYITTVGGTTLTMNGTGASYNSETVWNWGYDANAGGYLGSSGGVSSYYSIPVWQQGVNSFLVNGGSTTMRNIPDVALTADNVYVLYGSGSSGNFGGTSCAAPLWAGFMALVNQQAASEGETGGLGFINPVIYEIANESIYNSVFNDITTGNNTWPSSPNAFYAVPGYDLCTGLGTPAGDGLINALLNPDPLVVVSNVGFNAVGSSGGPFNVASQTFYLTNAGSSSLTWSLVNTSSWLNVSGGGTLAAGVGGSTTVSLNTFVAGNLPSGIYTASLGFSNVTSGVTHYRFFTLMVKDALVISPTNSFSFIVQSGGSFSPATQTVILTNAGSASLNWSINNTSSWFNVSLSGGSLLSGAQTNVTITPTPALTNLANGIYSATLVVTNLTSQTTQTITVIVSVGQPLVQNYGFETGDFTDWTLTGDAGNYDFVDNGSATGISPHSGTYFAALGEVSVQAYLSQTLSTTAGQKYLLSLWLYNPTSGSSRRQNEFSVSWNGSTLYDQKNIAQSSWANLQFVVTATGANTVLQIGGRDDKYYLGLDDVSVTPVFAPSISTQPTNQTILSGSNAVFSVTAAGTDPLDYQWRENGTNLVNNGNVSGVSTDVLTITGATTNHNGNYSLVVTNAYGAVTSSVAALTVVLPPTISWSFTNLVLAADTNCSVPMPDVTGTNYILATDLSGALTITQTPTNNSILPLGTNTIVITVADNSGNTVFSTNTIVVLDETPPLILLQPQSRTNIVGKTADFTVAATACTPISYQWFFEDAALTNKTNSTLVIGSVDTTNAGNYFAVASASGGSVTSIVATLTVYVPPPTFTGLTVAPDGGFNLNLTGAPDHIYVLEVKSDLSSTNWLPIATNTLGADGVWQFSDSQATNFQQRFYRIRELQ